VSRRVVAIDGPAGAGKSSASRGLAARLGFAYVDTGAMYRAVGVLAEQRGIALDDDAALEDLIDGLRIDEAGERLIVDGHDLSGAVRSAAAGELASRVSMRPVVRARLVALQRTLGREGDVVMEGRDIGTVVFPNAELKIFLEASLETRAGRRWREHQERGDGMTIDEVLAEVRERDRRDRERNASPLVRAADAVLVDNTAMGIEETARLIVLLVRERETELSRRSTPSVRHS
jgi:CMP/dCMP kinase